MLKLVVIKSHNSNINCHTFGRLEINSNSMYCF